MIYLLIAVVIIIVIDLLIRYVLRKAQEIKQSKEWASALEAGLNLDFSREAKSLKRVEVDRAKARILCIDDEPVVLESFRKILVLDGYSVDTVEHGMEAIHLIRSNHYDFVYVDLKMPEMDGVKLTRAIKHIRPDIDVVIITGYASVDTAVETMKYGAIDYVQKPFTEEELLALTKRCLVKRRARIKRELGPRVQIAEVSDFHEREIDRFSIPGGVFISEGHCWISLNEDGSAKIGIDDFAKKMIGKIDAINPPNISRLIHYGEPLFDLRQGKRIIPFSAPLSGKVIKLNEMLLANPDRLDSNCYDKNWICVIDSENIDSELKNLKIGKSAVSFFQDEIKDCHAHFKSLVKTRKNEKELAEHNGFWFGKINKLTDKEWAQTIKKYFIR